VHQPLLDPVLLQLVKISRAQVMIGLLPRQYVIHWLFRYVISASMHADFRMIPHESASHSMGYGHAPSIGGEALAMCVSAGVTLRQRLQQRLGLLEVGGVKAFGEPAVDGCQQLARVVPLALPLPQAAEANGGA
jgi:hypothetical protein